MDRKMKFYCPFGTFERTVPTHPPHQFHIVLPQRLSVQTQVEVPLDLKPPDTLAMVFELRGDGYHYVGWDVKQF